MGRDQKISFQRVSLPTQNRKKFKGTALVSALQFQKNGDILCGLLFASANLFRISLDSSGQASQIVDQKIEEKVGDPDLWGIGHGLRGTSTGDTVFSTWHSGFLPGMVGGLFGKNLDSVPLDKVHEFCVNQNGGSFARHSIVEVISGEYVIRRSKESGLLWDVAHIGDYIFGLEMGAVWREPYLHSEKRETLRGDLGLNYYLNKDKGEEGLFWFAGQDERLFRLALTDIKAKPTTIRVPGSSGIEKSKASSFDGWLYCVCADSKILVRVRRNPVSAQEELQVVYKSERVIQELEIFDSESEARLVMALGPVEGTGSGSVEILTTELVRTPDPEDIGEAPKLTSVGLLEGISGVKEMAHSPTSTSKRIEIWAGHGNWDTLAKSHENKNDQIQLLRFEI
jgi:hypothetical protein